MMNPLQAINSAASFAIFSALIAGLVRMFDVDDDILWSSVVHNFDAFLLAVFIVLFRIKMHFDDHRYFATADLDIGHFQYMGVVLAILVWIEMAVSAGTVDRPKVSAWFLLISLLTSSIWIFTHFAQLVSLQNDDSRPTILQRLSWATFNMIYCMALGSYIMAGRVETGLFRNWSYLVHTSILLFMVAALIAEKVLGRTYVRFLE